MTNAQHDRDLDPPIGSVREIFSTFLKLGLTSFGGPIAHLGYFRNELVVRRKWVTEEVYAQLLALCQFLPGPASSQLGFSLAMLRGGWLGALVAFTCFTLPSAVLLVLFATWLPHITGGIGEAALHGLKLVALSVVAHGVLGMSRKLCPDLPRGLIALVAAAIVLLAGQAWAQLLVIGLGALLGLAYCQNVKPTTGSRFSPGYGSKTGWTLLAFFGLLLLGIPLLARGTDGMLSVFDAFYRSGALVFGGGHVVLPLLEEAVVAPGWISEDEFLAGYGAAQAIPGPLFSFSAYLGASLPGEMGGLNGALIALAALFLPGFLLVSGFLPLWQSVAEHPNFSRAVAGVNAAVVGLLGAALYDPLWVSGVRSPFDFIIALIGFVLLSRWKLPAILVVAWCVLASVVVRLL